MRGKKETVRIPVNGSYAIEVDNYNWTVLRMGVKGKKAKTPGEVSEFTLSHHHNLSHAIQGIIADKTRRDEVDMSSLPAYLTWYESISHSLADRVLRQRDVLKEALKINSVM